MRHEHGQQAIGRVEIESLLRSRGLEPTHVVVPSGSRIAIDYADPAGFFVPIFAPATPHRPGTHHVPAPPLFRAHPGMLGLDADRADDAELLTAAGADLVELRLDTVDRPDVAGGLEGRLEALEVRLDGAREEPVLGPLPDGTGVALAL